MASLAKLISVADLVGSTVRADAAVTSRPASLGAAGLILGGVGLGLAFPVAPLPGVDPVALWPLAWFALFPLLSAIRSSKSLPDVLWSTVYFGTAWFLASASWLFGMFDSLAWVFVAMWIAWLTLFSVTARLTLRAGLSPWLVWPILWIACEYLRSECSPFRLDLLTGQPDSIRMSWYVLGHSRVSAPGMAQTASLWGGYGLSLLPFLCNLFIAELWNQRRLSRVGISFFSVVLLVELSYSMGEWLASPAEERPVRVAVVQSERYSLDAKLDLTRQQLTIDPEVDLIVWPECSWRESPGDVERISRFTAESKKTIVAACDRIDPREIWRNVAYWITPDGLQGEYHKIERVPLIDRHQPGREYPVFTLVARGQQVQLGIVICYDLDFPAHVRNVTARGAELIAIPTMDMGAWGGTQHAQHALLCRVRAMENRVPIVQANSSGMSQIIDARGQILARLPYDVERRPKCTNFFFEGTASASVSPRPIQSKSAYTRWGYRLAPITALTALLLVLVAIYRMVKGVGQTSTPEQA